MPQIVDFCNENKKLYVEKSKQRTAFENKWN